MSSATVICTLRAKPGREDELLDLLNRHWPTLRSLDLVTEKPPQYFQGTEKSGMPIVYEIFEWRSQGSAGQAHSIPDVSEIWATMADLTEERDGRPNMEFQHVQSVRLKSINSAKS